MPPATFAAIAHQELDSLLQEAVARHDLPHVVAVVANRDTTLYQGAVGVAPSDIFRIASMTKPVTSVAIMMLAERGLLGLDDPLERYLPQYGGREVMLDYNAADDSLRTRPATQPVTLRHLLAHTAGFSYDFCNEAVLVLCQDGTRAPRDLPLLFDPGDGWAYGCATGILGDVITQVTSEPFYTFQKREILQPLGMVDTDYFLDDAGIARLVPLHFREGTDYIPDTNDQPHRPHLAADGGLLGTAADYIRFLQMLLNEGELGEVRLLSAASVHAMTRNQIGDLTVSRQAAAKPRNTRPFPMGANQDKFGLGFQLKVGEETHLRAPGSYSWGGIFNTHFWADPATGIAAVLLTQILPFYDDQVMRVLRDFEQCVYRNFA